MPTALITGASAGIGECFAKHLAAEGYTMVLVARRKDKLEALAEALAGSHEVLTADLLTPEGVRQVEQRLAQGVDLLINNAGIGPAGAFTEIERDKHSAVISLNIDALTRLTHAALPTMLTRKSGAIVQIASLAAFQPSPHFAVYAATKAYVLSFSEAVHEEAKGSGVQVLTVCPGFTRTEFQDANDAHAEFMPDALWSTPDQVVSAALAKLGSGRAVVVPRWHDWATSQIVGWLPRAWVRRIAGSVGASV